GSGQHLRWGCDAERGSQLQLDAADATGLNIAAASASMTATRIATSAARRAMRRINTGAARDVKLLAEAGSRRRRWHGLCIDPVRNTARDVASRTPVGGWRNAEPTLVSGTPRHEDGAGSRRRRYDARQPQ